MDEVKLSNVIKIGLIIKKIQIPYCFPVNIPANTIEFLLEMKNEHGWSTMKLKIRGGSWTEVIPTVTPKTKMRGCYKQWNKNAWNRRYELLVTKT